MQVTIDISNATIACVLECAHTGYWGVYDANTIKLPNVALSDELKKFSQQYVAPIVGGSVTFIEYDNGEERQHILDHKRLKNGLNLMAEKYPEHMFDITHESYDAFTGDILIQC